MTSSTLTEQSGRPRRRLAAELTADRGPERARRDRPWRARVGGHQAGRAARASPGRVAPWAVRDGRVAGAPGGAQRRAAARQVQTVSERRSGREVRRTHPARGGASYGPCGRPTLDEGPEGRLPAR